MIFLNVILCLALVVANILAKKTVTCRFTCDDRWEDVSLNGAEISGRVSSAGRDDWTIPKTVSFNPVLGLNIFSIQCQDTITIEPHPVGSIFWAGLQCKCTSKVHPEWNFVTGTNDWLAIGAADNALPKTIQGNTIPTMSESTFVTEGLEDLPQSTKLWLASPSDPYKFVKFTRAVSSDTRSIRGLKNRIKKLTNLLDECDDKPT
jgi:hypothetical protein